MSDFQQFNGVTHPIIRLTDDWNNLLAHGLMKTASYIVRNNGGVYEAIDGDTGKIAYGGAGVAGGVTGTLFPPVVEAAASNRGLIFIKQGTYIGSPSIPYDKTLIFGEGRRTIISGDLTLGTTAARNDYIGVYNLAVEGTIAFIDINQAYSDKIYAERFVSAGNWGANFGDLILQNGTSAGHNAIFENNIDAASGENNTDTIVHSILMEDNTANTDVAIYNCNTNWLYIDQLHIESHAPLGWKTWINNDGRMHVSNALLYPELTDVAGSIGIDNSGELTGNFKLDLNCNRSAITDSGNYSNYQAHIGQTYPSGNVTINGDNNIIDLISENSIDITISGDNNIIRGVWTGVFGTLVNSGTHNNFDNLIWIDNAGVKYLFINGGKAANVANLGKFNHGLYGNPDVGGGCVLLNATIAGECAYINSLSATQVEVTTRKFNGDPGTTQDIVWMARYFPR